MFTCSVTICLFSFLLLLLFCLFSFGLLCLLYVFQKNLIVITNKLFFSSTSSLFFFLLSMTTLILLICIFNFVKYLSHSKGWLLSGRPLVTLQSPFTLHILHYHFNFHTVLYVICFTMLCCLVIK